MADLLTMIDNFASLDSTLWSLAYGSYSVTGGRGRVVTDSNFSGFQTAKTWSMAVGSSVYVRAYPDTVAGSGATESYTGFRIIRSSPDGTDVGFNYTAMNNTLVFESRVGYFESGPPFITYDPVNHAFWRLYRSTTTTLLFQTAPDDGSGNPGTWTTRRTLTLPTWITSATNLSVLLEAHRTGGSVVGYSEFDGLNGVAGAGAPANTVKGQFLQFF